ncbi:membrane protein [Promicromonospora xylanilytica]
MTWSEMALVVLGALAVGLLLAWRGASRLDRLHRKVAASRIALDAQLVRRASAAVELAASGALDPASAVLVADAAYTASDAGPVTSPAAALKMDGLGPVRERAESGLTATLREAMGGPEAVRTLLDGPAGEVVAALGAAWYRATLARRFHNEAVAQARRVRRLWYVRWFRLAGRAPMPRTVELDDVLPHALELGGG